MPHPVPIAPRQGAACRRPCWGRRLLLVLLTSGPVWGEPTLEEQRHGFREAEQALRQNRPDLARAKAAVLAGYPLETYLQAQILQAEPFDEPAIRAFLERHGDSRHAGPLRRKWLDRLWARGDASGFLQWYRESQAGEEDRCRYLQALFRTGRQDAAFAGAARFWDSGEPVAPACEPVVAAWRASPAYTPAHFWARFEAALGDSRTTLATQLIELAPAGERDKAERWLKLHGEPGLAEQCGIFAADDALDGRMFAHGVERLARSDPMRAAALWNLRRSALTVPPGTAARLDRELALALAHQRRPEAAAYLAALEDAEADPGSRAWRVRAAIANQDWPAVRAALDRLDPAERAQPNWRYWRARVLAQAGDPGAAALYRDLAGELEFYGFLAADRGAVDYRLNFAAARPPAGELARLSATPAFRAMTEFRFQQKPGEALREWAETIPRLAPGELSLAARLAADWHWHRQAIAVLHKTTPGDNLDLRFPLAFIDAVSGAAAAQRLDPAFVFALIRRESAFDPEARSPVGAMGLMQLMPTTAAEVARKLGEAGTTARHLLDPTRNIRLGSAYFRGLLDRFGGHPALAAAGYNAGPGRADRWQPADAPLPADVWIESIPFDETRHYVMAVLTYATFYRTRLGQPARIDGWLTDIPTGQKGDPRRPAVVSVPDCG